MHNAMHVCGCLFMSVFCCGYLFIAVSFAAFRHRQTQLLRQPIPKAPLRPFCTSKASYDAFKEGSGYTVEDDPDHIRCVHSLRRESGEAKHRIRTVSAGSSEADGKNKKATF